MLDALVVGNGAHAAVARFRLGEIVEVAQKLTFEIQRWIEIRLGAFMCPVVLSPVVLPGFIVTGVILSRRAEVKDPRQFHQRIVFVQRTLAVITGISTAVRHGVFLTQTLDAARRLHTLHFSEAMWAKVDGSFLRQMQDRRLSSSSVFHRFDFPVPARQSNSTCRT